MNQLNFKIAVIINCGIERKIHVGSCSKLASQVETQMNKIGIMRQLINRNLPKYKDFGEILLP